MIYLKLDECLLFLKVNYEIGSYVKEAYNNETILIEKTDISNLANQTIRFLGVSDTLFGELKTNLNTNTASFSVNTSEPHSYYEGETYASIKVSNSKGVVVYEKVVQGTNAEAKTDNIPLSEGDKIEIFHDETKNRLTSSEKIINPANKTNTWIVTKKGLKNEELSDTPEDNLIRK
ncbi:hypothetical protein IGL98_001118 [Enterococcus sp. DIV0840]|uniref:putative mucin/carbohydrate-binding domain-containing protein n=1 Tax=unclassified Enterococcus TaxID=2608891 RepID=UPI0030D34011